MDTSQAMLVFVVAAPGVAFFILAVLWLVGWIPPERVVSALTGSTFTISLVALAMVLRKVVATRVLEVCECAAFQEEACGAPSDRRTAREVRRGHRGWAGSNGGRSQQHRQRKLGAKGIGSPKTKVSNYLSGG